MCEYITICRKCYAVYLEEFNKKKKKKSLPRSELGLDFRPLGLLWTWFWVELVPAYTALQPHMENCLYVNSLFSGVETRAKRSHLQEGKGLTFPSLIPGLVSGWVPGFQDKLVLDLLGPLQEGLLEGRSRSGALQFLLQQPSTWNIAQFNSIRMFMTYMEKKLNTDSDRWWWVGSNPPYRERVCHTGVTADLQGLLGREGCDSRVSTMCTLSRGHAAKSRCPNRRV